MGFFKKISNTLFGSSGSKYNQDKSALTQEYGVQSPLGKLEIVKNADGTYSKKYTTNANDDLRNSLINQQLKDLTLDSYNPSGNQYTFGSLLSDPTTGYKPQTVSDPTGSYNPSSITDPSAGYNTTQLYGKIGQDTADNSAQSYYDQATRLLNNQFDRDRKTMDTNLINRGIQTGTEQYNQVMGDLADRQNATLSDIANQAVFQGQNLLGTMLENQARQTSNEGSEIGNRNALLQNQAQFLQNQGLNTTNEGLVFDNQGKLINNQAGMLSNQGRQLSNEGAYYGNIGQILANQGQRVSNEGNVLNNQYRGLANEGLGLSNAGQYYSNQNQRINNANLLGGGRDILNLPGMGGSNSAYDSAYQGSIYNDQQRNQRNKSMLGAVGSLAMAGSALFSDKRLKENLKTVGKLNNGLKVYVGNYKKETGLDTTPQLFLLAQEVKKKHPEAVGKKFGALTVNYKKATK